MTGEMHDRLDLFIDLLGGTEEDDVYPGISDSFVFELSSASDFSEMTDDPFFFSSFNGQTDADDVITAYLVFESDNVAELVEARFLISTDFEGDVKVLL